MLDKIEAGKGVLTDEERAALEAYADEQGAPKTVFQVYDDTGIRDDDWFGTVKAGDPHLTTEAAVAWAEEQNLESWSAYRETRCITRRRKIWYMQASSPFYSCN